MQAFVIPRLIPAEFCQFFTHVLLRNADLNPDGDKQVPSAKTVMHHEVLFETLQERLWPLLEKAVGEELIPTYAYARLYSNGDILKKHTDRPSCEVSITIQLGRSHHYAWPIYAGDQRFDLAEGDGMVYSGCDVEHWRDQCDGPEGYYAGQVFLHFVRKHGPYADYVGDKREVFSYVRNRTFAMESK